MKPHMIILIIMMLSMACNDDSVRLKESGTIIGYVAIQSVAKDENNTIIDTLTYNDITGIRIKLVGDGRYTTTKNGQYSFEYVTYGSYKIQAIITDEFRNDGTTINVRTKNDTIDTLCINSRCDMHNEIIYLPTPHPNPFKYRCNILFNYKYAMHIWTAIYDLHGQEVRLLINREFDDNYSWISYMWDGNTNEWTEAPDDIYFVLIKSDSTLCSYATIIKQKGTTTYR